MKTAAVYTGSAAFAKTLTELLPEYNTTYESVSAGFSGADMNVLDLYDMVVSHRHIKNSLHFSSPLCIILKAPKAAVTPQRS